MTAVCDQRPAIIRAGPDAVDFVATARTVLNCDKVATKVQRRALRVPVAIAPDRRARAYIADERIIQGDRAVPGDAND